MDGEERVVLVSDDDEDIRALVAYRLEATGYRVLEAEDGEGALRLALEHVPDVAVLDVMMPVLSGVEVVRRLRADERTRHIPVILLTARVLEKDVAAGFEAGADDYLAKPFSPRELQARIQAVLARR